MREWIDRYVYAVTRRLPQGQRADVERELRGLIEDMLEERGDGDQSEAGRTEAVLKAPGHPEDLAAKYRGRERYLIGPGVYGAYLAVLAVTVASIALGMTVAFLIQLAFDPRQSVSLLAGYAVDLLLAVLQGFAWVTIVFALIERRGSRPETDRAAERKDWSPAELPPVPDPGLDIRLREPVAAIAWLVAAFTLFLASAGWLVADRSESVHVILLFDQAAVKGHLMVLLPAFVRPRSSGKSPNWRRAGGRGASCCGTRRPASRRALPGSCSCPIRPSGTRIWFADWRKRACWTPRRPAPRKAAGGSRNGRCPSSWRPGCSRIWERRSGNCERSAPRRPASDDGRGADGHEKDKKPCA